MKLFLLIILALTSSYCQQSPSSLDYAAIGSLDREFAGCSIAWSDQVTSKRRYVFEMCSSVFSDHVLDQQLHICE
jgi:septal ring-binding cell division protein DamX